MSRILEFQPTDEQTVVARVLLELHQAIDIHFPEARGSSRQFTKTVLSSQAENTAIDLKPSEVLRPGHPQSPQVSSQAKNELASSGSGLEFSQSNIANSSLQATALQESKWSVRLTKSLLGLLFIGVVLLAWVYLFGPPI